MKRLPITVTLALVLLLSLLCNACTYKSEAINPSESPSGAANTLSLSPSSAPTPTEALEDREEASAQELESYTSDKASKGSADKDKSIPDNSDTSSKKRMIAVDAGHQGKGNSKKEPIGPGASTYKPKVSSGTTGAATKVPEYKLNLAIALLVKQELLDRGYEVFMIRETHDVNLSNRERAEMANESGADLFIRIHADGSENASVSGTSTLYPSKDNPYVSFLYKDSYDLSKAIVDAMCDQTGAKNRGAIARDDMSGINWCTIPVSIIEMGYMSNKKEDQQMQKEDYQKKMVSGICDGIDQYYKLKE